MVLCVSKIFWPAVKSGPDGESIDLKPLEIELTDGWYRIRTQIDKALIRAVKKGNLCVGKKIVVAGASVCLSLTSYMRTRLRSLRYVAAIREKRPRRDPRGV